MTTFCRGYGNSTYYTCNLCNECFRPRRLEDFSYVGNKIRDDEIIQWRRQHEAGFCMVSNIEQLELWF